MVSTTCPAVRTTNMSPRPWSKMISAATRESEQPNRTVCGCCAADVSRRRSAPCDGCSGASATKRSFPVRSVAHASAGVSERTGCAGAGEVMAPIIAQVGACSACPFAWRAAPGGGIHGG
ncbi:Uncharacterised protein [Mycobacteroides abscessus]|nr:Uncharacterised protein [Mycobacteroides abscessus]